MNLFAFSWRWTREFAVAGACLALAASALAQYPKQGVRMLSRIPLSEFPNAPTSGAGCAGYVSPSGQEYAIMGVRNGTVVVRITDPANPVQVGFVEGLSSTWHEMTVMGSYLYSVADAVDQGMQIIDLSLVDMNVVTLVGTYHGNELNRVHTIQANPVTKMLYLNGSNRGFVMLDATNPTAPVEVGRWTTKYVHDSQVVSYTSGPYAGREIAFLCCAGSGLYIVDVTNRAAPTVLSQVPYLAGSYYSHSGQLTADRKYFLINDEFDERNGLVTNCSTHIVDVSDLDNPSYKGPFVNPIGVIDHNSHRVANFLYLAAYRGGLRVYDVSNPLAMRETGFFDTFPADAGFVYEGAWGAHVFPSGNVMISDINRGLFVLDPSEAVGKGAPLLSVTPTGGEAIGGDLDSLREADRDNYTMRWTPAMGNPARMQFVLDSATTVSPAQFLDVAIKCVAPRKITGPVALELFNWQTSSYTAVGSFTLARGKDSHTFAGIAASSLVSANGSIRARITVTQDPTLRGAEFRAQFDAVRFDVRRN